MSTTAVEIFAGAGGLSEAALSRDVDTTGLEIDPAAVATATAAGHARIGPGPRGDVYAQDPARWSGVDGLIGAPPCEGFSPAGLRRGVGDMGVVRRLIADLADGRDTRVEALFEVRDTRSLLVAEPLRYALAIRPRWVVLEQVPAVLPLWQAIGAVLRGHGYYVWTGLVHAERYGVPQTRTRAVMLASVDHPVGEPRPTHSRYYPRTPTRLDPGVHPWVSMAQALGYGMTDRPYPTVSPGAGPGGTDPLVVGGTGGRAAIERERAAGRWLVGLPRLDDGRRDGSIVIDGTAYRARDLRDVDAPAPTLTEKARSWVLRSSAQTNATVRRLDEPAPTITGSRDYGERVWTVLGGGGASTAGQIPRRLDEPEHTITAKGTAAFVDGQGRDGERDEVSSERISITQAAILQSFRPDYPWQGTRSDCYQQIGRAVPPRLGAALLDELLRP